jgi:hypothetical protein
MNTSRLLVAVGVVLCLVLSPVIALMPANTAQAQPADSPWPMLCQNPQHTGRSPYSGPEVPKLKWSFTTGDRVGSSPAIGADGVIYVGSHDSNLYAIDPDGSLKWSFTTGAWVFSSPAIGADGTIHVGSDDRKLYAINPDGSQKWSFTTGAAVASSPAIGADGTIYVGSADNKLYAITAKAEEYDLTISSTAGGSVFAPGEGTFTYVPGTELNLVAEVDEGYRFVNWAGDVDTIAEVEDATTTIVMNGDYSISANFRPAGGCGCFIATAAYGTPMAEEIEILGEFRDKYLLTNPVGQALAALYYKVSPPLAEFIAEDPSVKPIVRAGLLPAVAMSAVAVNTTPAQKLAIVGLAVLVSAALAIWATRRRGRDLEYR